MKRAELKHLIFEVYSELLDTIYFKVSSHLMEYNHPVPSKSNFKSFIVCNKKLKLNEIYAEYLSLLYKQNLILLENMEESPAEGIPDDVKDKCRKKLLECGFNPSF